MSMRWALMSSRPSSNTAKSPIGPAPMMTASVLMMSLMKLFRMSRPLALTRRRRNDETVQRGGHFDLAGEARIGPDLEGEIKHVLLHLLRLADDLRPFG